MLKRIIEDEIRNLLTDNDPKQSKPIKHGKKIVVLQRGWVVVGDFSQKGDYCHLENAYVIRRWGTTEGLGELAIKGKLENTKLDKCPPIDFHILTSIMIIDCSEAWND